MAETKETKEREETRTPALWRPFGEFARWPTLFEGLFPEMLREWPRRAGALVPAVDVAEDDSQYLITVELPGARKDDVHVELREGMLVVHGEKKSEREEKKARSHYVERCYGAFSRSFSLPPDADADRLAASFKDGVLTITLPRTEASKPKQIAIKG